jgi:hypothetical protein
MQRAGSYYIAQLNTAANPRAITACSNGLFDTISISMRPSGSALKISYVDASGLRTAKVVVTCGGDSALSSPSGTFRTTLDADTGATRFSFFLQSNLVCGPSGGAPTVLPDDDDDYDDGYDDSGSSSESSSSDSASGTNGRGAGPAAPSTSAVGFWSSPWFIFFLLAAVVVVVACAGSRSRGQNVRGVLRGFFFSVVAAAPGAHATSPDHGAHNEDSSSVVRPEGVASAPPVAQARRAYTRLDTVDSGGGGAHHFHHHANDDVDDDGFFLGHRVPSSLHTGELTTVVNMPTPGEGTAAAGPEVGDALDDAEEMQPMSPPLTGAAVVNNDE